MTTNHKNVYTCQKTLYAAVLKHIVRATKLSYQKLENARIKLACLIPFLPPKILAPRMAQDCLSHFPECSPTVYSLSSVIDPHLICCSLLMLFSTQIYCLYHRVFYGTCRRNIRVHYSSPQMVMVETNFHE